MEQYGVFFSDDHLLTTKEHREYLIPIEEMSKEANINFINKDYFYLGKFETKDVYAVHLDLRAKSFKKFIFIPVRDFLTTATLTQTKFVLRGKQLISWHRSTLYCGSCGSPTSISDLETAKICQACKKIIYPYSYAAIILLIENGNHILLARSPHFPKGVYSTLAGFIAADESCEDAINREVKEEVGILVKNIEYFNSQSWPFPNSFMLGFKAQYASGKLCIQKKEIEDAKWFTKCNLPLLPSKSSIARQLIDSITR